MQNTAGGDAGDSDDVRAGWKQRGFRDILEIRNCAVHQVNVNRTPTHAACTDAHSLSAHHTAQSDHFPSREHVWLKFQDLCAENVLSSTRHVSFLAAPDTDHQHMFSLTYLSNLTFCTPKLVCLTIHIYTATIHGGVAVPRISNLTQ